MEENFRLVGLKMALKKAATQWSNGRSCIGKKAKATPKSAEITIIGQAMIGWDSERMVKIKKANPTPAARYPNCFKVMSPTR